MSLFKQPAMNQTLLLDCNLISIPGSSDQEFHIEMMDAGSYPEVRTVVYQRDIRIITSNHYQRHKLKTCTLCKNPHAKHPIDITTYDHVLTEFHQNSIILCDDCMDLYIHPKELRASPLRDEQIDGDYYRLVVIEDGDKYLYIKNKQWPVDVFESLECTRVYQWCNKDKRSYAKRYSHWVTDLFSSVYALAYFKNDCNKPYTIKSSPCMIHVSTMEDLRAEFREWHVLVSAGGLNSEGYPSFTIAKVFNVALFDIEKFEEHVQRSMAAKFLEEEVQDQSFLEPRVVERATRNKFKRCFSQDEGDFPQPKKAKVYVPDLNTDEMFELVE